MYYRSNTFFLVQRGQIMTYLTPCIFFNVIFSLPQLPTRPYAQLSSDLRVTMSTSAAVSTYGAIGTKRPTYLNLDGLLSPKFPFPPRYPSQAKYMDFFLKGNEIKLCDLTEI
jgi:hypothetical protein